MINFIYLADTVMEFFFEKAGADNPWTCSKAQWCNHSADAGTHTDDLLIAGTSLLSAEPQSILLCS